MNIQRVYGYALLLLLLFATCTKEEIDLNPDKISKKYDISTGISTPLIQGSLTISDIIPDDDSTFTYYDDSIVFTTRTDSIINFSLDNFLNTEATLNDVLGGFQSISNRFEAPGSFIAPADQQLTFPALDYNPGFPKRENVDIDSIVLNSGEIIISITSTFPSPGTLSYGSSFIKVNGQALNNTMPVTTDATQTGVIPLSDAVIVLDDNDNDSLKFNLNFELVLNISAGDVIDTNDYLELSISMDGIGEYEYVFGYFGETTIKEFGQADTISLGLENEAIKKLSGDFSLGRPSINWYYRSSFGMDLVFDLGLSAFFAGNKEDSVVFDRQVIAKPVDYRNPDGAGVTSFAISEINKILRIPPPEALYINGGVYINPNGEELLNNYKNFIKPDSHISMDIEITTPLELGIKMQFRDTIRGFKIDEISDIDEEGFVRLHYYFQNGIPLGLDLQLIMLDSINIASYAVIDTFNLNETPGEIFLEPAPVGNSGVVIADQIEEKEGYIEIGTAMAKKMFVQAEKLIIIASLATSDVPQTNELGSVKLSPDLFLNFKFGCSAAASVSGYLDKNNDTNNNGNN